MKKKSNQIKLIKYIKFIIFTILFTIGFYFLSSWMSINEGHIMPLQHYTYKCDNITITEDCADAKWNGASVLIYNCDSGKSYVCQTLVEIPVTK